MRTAHGGGWTKVTPANAASAVDRIKGTTSREMLKCSDVGPEAIISPPFSLAWEWNGHTFNELAGTWSVNGVNQTCGNDPEYANAPCTTWFGVGCGDGPGGNNKLFPGVLDSPSAEFCSDETSAHTNGAFSVCGTNNNRSYGVFVRAE